MSVSLSDVCIATFLCSLITIAFYVISWLIYEENNEEQPKEANTSNLQGFENEKPTPRGEPNEIIDVNSETEIPRQGEHSTGVHIREKSDILRTQYDDFRTRVTEHNTDVLNTAEIFQKNEEEIPEEVHDPVVHPDPRPGRIQLSIRYDDERSKLIVQVLDAQGLIPVDANYAPEMFVNFTLKGLNTDEKLTEHYTRVFVENPSVVWKEPMKFCVTFENAKKQNLYVRATNRTDPAASNDREVTIPLNNLDKQAGAITEWFDLQYIQSTD